MEIIIREGRRERAQRIFGRVRADSPNAGVARNAEEACDILYHERDIDKPLVCEGGPERYQAFVDDMLRIGKDPEEIDRQWHGEQAQKKPMRSGRSLIGVYKI